MAYLENKVDEAKVIPSLRNVFQLTAAAFPVTCSCPQTAHLRGHQGTAHEQTATYEAGSIRGKKEDVGECTHAAFNAS